MFSIIVAIKPQELFKNSLNTVILIRDYLERPYWPLLDTLSLNLCQYGTNNKIGFGLDAEWCVFERVVYCHVVSWCSWLQSMTCPGPLCIVAVLYFWDRDEWLLTKTLHRSNQLNYHLVHVIYNHLPTDIELRLNVNWHICFVWDKMGGKFHCYWALFWVDAF